MRKKVKHLLRKKQSEKQNSKKYTASPVNVDICNVNIVSEAEKIIEEYAYKMGYKFAPQKNSRAPLLMGISAAVCTLMVLLALAAKFLLV